MIPKIPILRECSYEEYSKNIGREDVTYVRYIIAPDHITDPNEIGEFVMDNLENNHNTDIHKYFKLIGIVSNEKQEEEEQRLSNLSLNN